MPTGVNQSGSWSWNLQEECFVGKWKRKLPSSIASPGASAKQKDKT